MNPERMILALAVPYLVPSPQGRVYRRGDFPGYVDGSAVMPPMLDGHDETRRLGSWRCFAEADLPGATKPIPGLLALGEFEHSPLGQATLRRVEDEFDPFRPGPLRWAVSPAIGAYKGRWVIKEISTVFEQGRTKPGFADAAVIAVGPYARDLWRSLTHDKPIPASSSPRATLRRLAGAFTDGRPIWLEGDS